jgi:hypothetical protein
LRLSGFQRFPQRMREGFSPRPIFSMDNETLAVRGLSY